MYYSRNVLLRKPKLLLGMFLIIFFTGICLAFNWDNGDYDSSKREVLLRKIGHEVLLQSGDSTSRVLPIKRLKENQYQIRFENALTFLPDSLITITQRLLEGDPVSSDYIVNVLNSSDSSVAYAFAISNDAKENIIACKGRKQPKASYLISIDFRPTMTTSGGKAYLFTGLPILAFVGFMLLKSPKPRKALIPSQQPNTMTIGSILFNTEKHQLLSNDNTINLTGTEARLLEILVLSANETVDRARLQKEIWEDEGVIVGRSLDMFISKLRKKLEIDPSLKIVNIRGRGYKISIATTYLTS
jgi:DNA-binding winged helix-turn-helix (wHTH) protein